VGEHDLVHVAREERRADGLLQLLDALAHRGLGATDALGGAGEVALLGHGQEMLELEQVHDPTSLNRVTSRLAAVGLSGHHPFSFGRPAARPYARRPCLPSKASFPCFPRPSPRTTNWTWPACGG